MTNGISGMDPSLYSAWKTGNMNYAASKARADEEKFAEALEKAKRDIEQAKLSADTTGISSEQESKRLREACQGFEAMFLDIVFKEMRKTVPENTLFGSDNAEKTWHSMLDTELMKNVAESGGVGIADMMYDQLVNQVSAEVVNAKGHIRSR